MNIKQEELQDGRKHITMRVDADDLKRMGFDKFPTREEFVQRMRKLIDMDKT